MADTQGSDETARIYAIGDIHGRLDLLDRAIAAIKRDVAEHGGTALTVTLGDYVDRGPASRGVLDRLSANPFPTPYVALKGNHELMLEAFLADPALGPQWRDFGGLETLHSYGIPTGRVMMTGDYPAATEALREAITPHLAFLQSLKTSHSNGKYFLCHAGVRPGIALDRQDDHDLMWIRAEFLDSDMDTGAFASGRLTCVVLDAGPHRFLKV